MQNIYTLNNVRKLLKQFNLPHSYNSILKYERAGIIPRGGQTYVSPGNPIRLYSQQEVAEIVASIRKFKKKI